jgi:hypothetical protein
MGSSRFIIALRPDSQRDRAETGQAVSHARHACGITLQGEPCRVSHGQNLQVMPMRETCSMTTPHRAHPLRRLILLGNAHVLGLADTYYNDGVQSRQGPSAPREELRTLDVY